MANNNLNEIARLANEQLNSQNNEKNIPKDEDIYKDLRQENNEDKYYNDSYDNNEDYSSIDNINIKNQPDFNEQEEYDIKTEPGDNYYNNYPEHNIDSNFSSPIFEGGPTKELIDIWKKQWKGYEIFLVELPGEVFVCRTLNRYEYKQIIALDNIDALQREEIICEKVTLWPSNVTWENMAVGKAGTPSTLAEIIMSKSGFSKEYNIQVL